MPLQPARVNDHEAAAVPLGDGVDAVTRRPRAILHHGLALADDAVEERALAHVRAADEATIGSPSIGASGSEREVVRRWFGARHGRAADQAAPARRSPGWSVSRFPSRPIDVLRYACSATLVIAS